ncbi:MAG: hypothetical protein WCT85_01130 [Parachlamydiales bacterium]|jgi:hypothetical protein
MAVLPLLYIPFEYSMRAFTNTHLYFIPDEIRDNVKNSPDQMCSSLIHGFDTTELQPFFDKIKMRKDLVVSEELNSGFCSALGTNFFKGDAAIMVSPGFNNEDKEACHWLLKHIACHIKNNDSFTMPCVPAICSIAAAVFSSLVMSIFPALLVTFAVGFIADSLFSQYCEIKADDLAIAEGTDEELMGGRRFLKSSQLVNLEARTTFWKKIKFSSSGDDRLDFFHPSLSSRIKKIERVLQKKDVRLSEREDIKITILKNYIANANSSAEKKAMIRNAEIIIEKALVS